MVLIKIYLTVEEKKICQNLLILNIRKKDMVSNDFKEGIQKKTCFGKHQSSSKTQKMNAVWPISCWQVWFAPSGSPATSISFSRRLAGTSTILGPNSSRSLSFSLRQKNHNFYYTTG